MQDKPEEGAATERFVLNYLKEHPRFLSEHPELLETLAPPTSGEKGVLDFQQFQLSRLQKNLAEAKSELGSVVENTRETHFIQSRVHCAVLQLVKAKTLEQLLDAVTQDLMALFEVDVVRLAVESEAAGLYETYYNEANYSGIAFVTPGVVDAALGAKSARLVVNVDKEHVAGFEEIFDECQRLVHSCALLRLNLVKSRRAAMLAFGVRDIGRFRHGQAVELLCFLAHIVEHKLDQCLSDNAVNP